MTNVAIRGQEITIRVSIGGQITQMRAKSFSATPRTDLIEDEYLGEDLTEIDMQHHGFDLSLTIDEEDDTAIRFLTSLTTREAEHLPPQLVTIVVMTAYRNGKTKAQIEVYPEVLLKLSERSMGGRKERVENSFEGKCKRREVLTA